MPKQGDVKLSVIMPVYNVGKYIKRAVDSVINQQFKDFEIILCNDGSSDNSGDICDQLAGMDERIKVIHKENGGVSSARNTSLDVARGKYIYFMDPDDYVVGEIFTENIECAEKYSCSQVIFGFYNVICESATDKEIKKLTFKHDIDGLYSYNEFKLIYKKHRSNVNQVVWNRIYRRDFIGDTRFKENLNTAEDAIFNLDLTSKGFESIYYNNNCYYVYLCRQNSLMNKYNPRRFENEMLINSTVEALVVSWGMEKEFENFMAYKYAESVLNEYGNMSMCNDKLSYGDIKKTMLSYCEKEPVKRAFSCLKTADFDSYGLKVLFTLTKKRYYGMAYVFKICLTKVSMFVNKIKSLLTGKI